MTDPTDAERVDYQYIATARCGCAYGTCVDHRDVDGRELVAATISEWILDGAAVFRLERTEALDRFREGLACQHDPRFSGLRQPDELVVPDRTDAAIIARDLATDLLEEHGRSSLTGFLERALPGRAPEAWWEDVNERLEEALIVFITNLPQPAAGEVDDTQLTLDGAA